MRHKGLSLLVIVALLLSGCAVATSPAGTPAPGPITLTVSAAADLIPAFTELGNLFEQATGIRVVFNFGSTGQLAQQIERGAPVDLFAAANVLYIEELEAAGLILPDTKAVYAVGRITLWTRPDSTLQLNSIHDLTDDDIDLIAIANPDHAPYGVAAREALQTAGLWETLQPKLVLGENVAHTLQYAELGNVDVAIVALSLSVATEGRWTLLPQELHSPLVQALAVIRDTPHEAAARQFAAFINGAAGRPVMRRYGFILPGETLDIQ